MRNSGISTSLVWTYHDSSLVYYGELSFHEWEMSYSVKTLFSSNEHCSSQRMNEGLVCQMG